mmetsp:Transcript_29957/g.67620  ORF Transcript_29957/g.67620 Transcript_29957/m.67620 type:complete len:162 (+) Transcript_29957:2659-3144(+)
MDVYPEDHHVKETEHGQEYRSGIILYVQQRLPTKFLVQKYGHQANDPVEVVQDAVHVVRREEPSLPDVPESIARQLHPAAARLRPDAGGGGGGHGGHRVSADQARAGPSVSFSPELYYSYRAQMVPRQPTGPSRTPWECFLGAIDGRPARFRFSVFSVPAG